MTAKPFILLSVLTLATSLTAQTTVVHFDGTNDYSGGTFQARGTITGGYGVAFDDTNPQVSGATGQNAVWYGGMIHTNGNGGAYNFQPPGALAGSYIDGIHHRLNASVSGDAAALAYWKVGDFLAGDGSTPVTIDATSSFDVIFDNLGAATATGAVVIETGSGFFTRGFSSFVNSGNGGTLTISGSDLLTDWRSYDPSTSLISSGSIVTPDLDDVIGLGYRINMTGLNFRVRVGEFQADVTVVPEPSSYALISGALALGWIMVRRRR